MYNSIIFFVTAFCGLNAVALIASARRAKQKTRSSQRLNHSLQKAVRNPEERQSRPRPNWTLKWQTSSTSLRCS
jgi:hypothetical protein